MTTLNEGLLQRKLGFPSRSKLKPLAEARPLVGEVGVQQHTTTAEEVEVEQLTTTEEVNTQCNVL